MTDQKYRCGAFVFVRARDVQPRSPGELEPLRAKHGIEEAVVPGYAGDRAAVGRAVAHAKAGLGKEGLLLRPIKRSATELVFGIVRETPDVVDQRLEHRFEATVAWSSEPDPGAIHGNHAVALRVAEAYQALRGKVVSEDWARTVTTFFESSDAARVRAGVYWLPPQRLDDVRRLGLFLDEVGIDLILCEVEADAAPVVRGAATQSLDEQLDRLQAEVEAFDGTQKPSTYARRLMEFQRLRERAGLYRDALGLGVERAESVLGELEQRVNAMLDLRSQTVIHRGGSATKVAASDAADSGQAVASLRFAGAIFTHATTTDGVAVYTSDDDTAQAQIAALERMGLAGRWQSVGRIAVSLQNSGPPGARVSIRLRNPSGQSLDGCAPGLSAIGIQLGGGTGPAT